MEKVTFTKVVGFVLAVALAIVIGSSMSGLLFEEYSHTHSEQALHSLRIAGFAGTLAVLVTWWVQRFVGKRGFVVRTLFALFIFVVAFFSFGGLLRIIYSHFAYPSEQDWSLSGLYWASQSDLISFVIYILAAAQPLAYAALALAAAVYVAVFGPRESKTVEI